MYMLQIPVFPLAIYMYTYNVHVHISQNVCKVKVKEIICTCIYVCTCTCIPAEGRSVWVVPPSASLSHPPRLSHTATEHTHHPLKW